MWHHGTEAAIRARHCHSDQGCFGADDRNSFIPDAVLYLSYWYNQYDLPIRMACFFCMNYLGKSHLFPNHMTCGIAPSSEYPRGQRLTVTTGGLITSFLAIPLLMLRGRLGYEGWVSITFSAR